MNLKFLSSCVVKEATKMAKEHLTALAIDIVVLVIDKVKEAVLVELSK